MKSRDVLLMWDRKSAVTQVQSPLKGIYLRVGLHLGWLSRERTFGFPSVGVPQALECKSVISVTCYNSKLLSKEQPGCLEQSICLDTFS